MRSREHGHDSCGLSDADSQQDICLTFQFQVIFICHGGLAFFLLHPSSGCIIGASEGIVRCVAGVVGSCAVRETLF